MQKNSNVFIRSSYAFAGIKAAFLRESSLRIQFLALAILVGLCIFLRIERVWCVIFLAMCCLVIALELINSAIEVLLDKLYPDYDVTVKFIKDCLAGSVLIASIGSVVIFILFLSTR